MLIVRATKKLLDRIGRPSLGRCGSIDAFNPHDRGQTEAGRTTIIPNRKHQQHPLGE